MAINRQDSTDDPIEQLMDVFDHACPSRQVFEDVVGKWGVLTLVALREQPYRFNALRRRIDGVSERMLAQTLQALEAHGFVHRDVQAAIPARVEYTLTESGMRISIPLSALLESIEKEVAAKY